MSTPPPRIVVITGVAGSGKTTVGRALAARLGWRFHDADDLHSRENVARMRCGLPLDDSHRAPWLLRVREVIADASARQAGTVIACSALKASYRTTLAAGISGVRFVFLSGDPALLRDRLARRVGHFAGASLLDSQLDALEPPEEALEFDVAVPVDAIVDGIVAELSR